MAKQIIWSRRAQSDRKEIFTYWNKRNRSNLYSKKLNELFKEAVLFISEYPGIGKPIDNKTIRVKIVRDYLIIYEVDQQNTIIILTIWDSRQDQISLEKILKD